MLILSRTTFPSFPDTRIVSSDATKRVEIRLRIFRYRLGTPFFANGVVEPTARWCSGSIWFGVRLLRWVHDFMPPSVAFFLCFYGWWREWIRIPIFFPPWNRLHGKIIGLKRRCDVTFVCKGSPPHPESLFEFHFSGGGFSNVISRNSSIFITCSIKWIGGEEGSFFISKTSMIGFVAFNIEPFCYITW